MQKGLKAIVLSLSIETRENAGCKVPNIFKANTDGPPNGRSTRGMQQASQNRGLRAVKGRITQSAERVAHPLSPVTASPLGAQRELQPHAYLMLNRRIKERGLPSPSDLDQEGR